MTETDRERARREWEDSARLVTYAPDVAELVADAHRDTLEPGPSAPKRTWADAEAAAGGPLPYTAAVWPDGEIVYRPTTDTDHRKARP